MVTWKAHVFVATYRLRQVPPGLRQLRNDRGVTGDEVAGQLLWSTAKMISRLEK